MAPLRKSAQQATAGTKTDQRLGVRIVLEFTGKLNRKDALRFTSELGSVLQNRMENGGGGN
ncbi:MAG: hypothetical protein NTW68_12035 [candidate division NC10 bacterium]|nr:hypothetical protein [candidate division NC10 bacterium]